jgi:hypothetical protein
LSEKLFALPLPHLNFRSRRERLARELGWLRAMQRCVAIVAGRRYIPAR